MPVTTQTDAAKQSAFEQSKKELEAAKKLAELAQQRLEAKMLLNATKKIAWRGLMGQKVQKRAERSQINKLDAQFVKTVEKWGMYNDGRGLNLLVSAGNKTWVLRYTLQKKAHTRGLGSIHDVSLAEARELRDEYRELLRQKIDPIRRRRQERAAHPKSRPEESLA
jgi:Arm DNA-binding domain